MAARSIVADIHNAVVLRARAGAQHDAERIVPVRPEELSGICRQYHVGGILVRRHQDLSAIGKSHGRAVRFLDLRCDHGDVFDVFAHVGTGDERKNVAGKRVSVAPM